MVKIKFHVLMFLLLCITFNLCSAAEVKVLNTENHKLRPDMVGLNSSLRVHWSVSDASASQEQKLLASQNKKIFGRCIEVAGKKIIKNSDGTFTAHIILPKKGTWYVKVQVRVKNRKYYSKTYTVKVTDPPIVRLSKMKGMYSPYKKPEPQAATWLLIKYDGKQANRDMQQAKRMKKFPVFSFYALLDAPNETAYRKWLKIQAEAIGKYSSPCVVVLEPDRFASGPKNDHILDWAIQKLKETAPNAAVFLDIGHSNWLEVRTVVERVKKYKSYALLDGFSTNVSNFRPDKDEERYARELYRLTRKPSIIDTSRNGLSSATGKCPKTVHNPSRSEWKPGATFKFHKKQPYVLFNYYNKPYHEKD